MRTKDVGFVVIATVPGRSCQIQFTEDVYLEDGQTLTIDMSIDHEQNIAIDGVKIEIEDKSDPPTLGVNVNDGVGVKDVFGGEQ